jgi:hypothetical protein
MVFLIHTTLKKDKLLINILHSCKEKMHLKMEEQEEYLT